MGRKARRAVPALGKHNYEKALLKLQIELVKLQRGVIAAGDRILVLIEGRDAAGKDGAIKHVIEHLSPRETRVVALGQPSDREQHSWYFQRYVPHLPSAGEMVLFNRSWYNRAGVEPVMGFCTRKEAREFLEAVPDFERMLVRSGIKLLKYYLDIGKVEQRHRLAERRRDPLKQWKLSSVDLKAQRLWRDYSKARDAMFHQSHTDFAPWTVVRADDKHHARLNLIRDLLSRIPYRGRDKRLVVPDRDIVFPFDPELVENGTIAR